MIRTTLISIAAAWIAAMSMPADADEMTEQLAVQYIYMEECKNEPPMPPDRLRTIDRMTEMVDKQELKETMIRMMSKLANNKEKTAEFCSKMTTMIKNEPWDR